VELARCSGDGKHVFQLITLLSPSSHFLPPPLSRSAHLVLGLTEASELENAIKLWLSEGEAVLGEILEPHTALEGSKELSSKETKKRIQKRGQRLSDQLKRKPKLKEWIASTALHLATSSRTRMTASRHPPVKASRLIVVGTALRLYGGTTVPVPCLSLKSESNEMALGEVGIPVGMLGERAARREEWAGRKKPQLQWMIDRMDEILPRNQARTILDVGGGRGQEPNLLQRIDTKLCWIML